jgi:ribosomal protein S17E
MYWLIGRNSKLSLENKILLYKTIIKPIWAYGAEIWGCASKSNISIIQRSQSKILRMLANAPWYAPSITLHEDLNVRLVKEVIKQRSTRYHNKIEGHVNVLIQQLLEPQNDRRLKRNWPADLREG